MSLAQAAAAAAPPAAPGVGACPPLEMVLAATAALYNNPDPAQKENASKWLLTLQNSVHAWTVRKQELFRSVRSISYEMSKRSSCQMSKRYLCCFQVSDSLLHRKDNLEACYFAAQTLRTKIQACHQSLKQIQAKKAKFSIPFPPDFILRAPVRGPRLPPRLHPRARPRHQRGHQQHHRHAAQPGAG